MWKRRRSSAVQSESNSVQVQLVLAQLCQSLEELLKERPVALTEKEEDEQGHGACFAVPMATRWPEKWTRHLLDLGRPAEGGTR